MFRKPFIQRSYQCIARSLDNKSLRRAMLSALIAGSSVATLPSTQAADIDTRGGISILVHEFAETVDKKLPVELDADPVQEDSSAALGTHDSAPIAVAAEDQTCEAANEVSELTIEENNAAKELEKTIAAALAASVAKLGISIEQVLEPFAMVGPIANEAPTTEQLAESVALNRWWLDTETVAVARTDTEAKTDTEAEADTKAAIEELAAEEPLDVQETALEPSEEKLIGSSPVIVTIEDAYLPYDLARRDLELSGLGLSTVVPLKETNYVLKPESITPKSTTAEVIAREVAAAEVVTTELTKAEVEPTEVESTEAASSPVENSEVAVVELAAEDFETEMAGAIVAESAELEVVDADTAEVSAVEADAVEADELEVATAEIEAVQEANPEVEALQVAAVEAEVADVEVAEVADVEVAEVEVAEVEVAEVEVAEVEVAEVEVAEVRMSPECLLDSLAHQTSQLAARAESVDFNIARLGESFGEWVASLSAPRAEVVKDAAPALIAEADVNANAVNETAPVEDSPAAKDNVGDAPVEIASAVVGSAVVCPSECELEVAVETFEAGEEVAVKMMEVDGESIPAPVADPAADAVDQLAMMEVDGQAVPAPVADPVPNGDAQEQIASSESGEDLAINEAAAMATQPKADLPAVGLSPADVSIEDMIATISQWQQQAIQSILDVETPPQGEPAATVAEQVEESSKKMLR